MSPYPPPKGAPIWVPCESSGAEANEERFILGMIQPVGSCRMCGAEVALTNGKVPDHDRDDILARLKRGDFG